MKITLRISRCTGYRSSLPKNPDSSPCLPPLDLMVQHVEKDEYPYKDPLTGAVQNRIPAEKPKLHPVQAPVFQRKYATFSGGLVFGKCIRYQCIVSLSCTCRDKGFGDSIHCP